jgi:hypothetical protein
MLLTLDETTLFFYSYSSKSETEQAKLGRFKSWLTDCVTIPQDNAGMGSATGSGKNSIPTSKATSTAIASSSHSKQVKSSKIIEIHDDDSESDAPAFEESQKAEREAALTSPVKDGK